MSISMLARQVLISDQNEGPIVNIPAWLGMTIMIFCVFTRIVSKWSVIRIWTVDDTVIMFTTVILPISVKNTPLICFAAARGCTYDNDINVGNSWSGPTPENLVRQKYRRLSKGTFAVSQIDHPGQD
jgi:hypothetical protein